MERDSVGLAATYYLKERRNALGKVKPLKTLKQKTKNNKVSSKNDQNNTTDGQVLKAKKGNNDQLKTKLRQEWMSSTSKLIAIPTAPFVVKFLKFFKSTERKGAREKRT